MNSEAAERDKLTERTRYNTYAEAILTTDHSASLGLDGAISVCEELRSPYVYYEEVIRSVVEPDMCVLDVCCGSGVHSLIGAHCGARVIAADIAESNLAVVRLRATRANISLETLIADAEQLPLPSHSVDLVTCAGGLSYVDLPRFLGEVTRVLKPRGVFVLVDSFNHNPIYRFNRYIHYLRGNRSRSTLERMPNRQSLAVLRAYFPDLVVRYFGIGSFLMPVIRVLVGKTLAGRFSDWIDAHFCFAKDWAFKIVAHGRANQTLIPKV